MAKKKPQFPPIAPAEPAGQPRARTESERLPGEAGQYKKQGFKLDPNRPGSRPGGGGGPRGGGARERPKNAGLAIRRILTYFKGFRLQLFFVLLSIIGSVGASTAGTYLLKPIINEYLLPFVGQQGVDLTGFAWMVASLAVVYLVGVASSYVQNRLMLNISTGIMRQIRVELFTHMENLPIRYFDAHTHGQLMSRYTTDTDTLREMVSSAIPQLFSSTLSLVSVFTMMLILSPILTILVVVMLLAMTFVVKTIGGRSASFFIKQQRAWGAVNGYIEEMIGGQKVVKVFCHEKAAKEEFDSLNDELFYAASSANSLASMMMPIMSNLSYIHYALTAFLGGVLAVNGMLDIGSIASFLQYTRNFSMPINQISQQFNSILTALAGAERIFEVIDETPETDDGYVTLVNASIAADGTVTESPVRTGHWAWKHPHAADGTVTYTLLTGAVEFEDVTFGYEPDKIVLDGITLYAEPGQKIALVGSTGAGKTTITNLINRFYDVPDGKIRYDGININKIKKSDLRRSLAMVLQDTHLFTGTVADNIRYGKLDATDEEVVAAARVANAHFFISHLPEGYNTLLTADGGNLSQGQRQLIAIARAAVADPPVLILDEATSSIDTRTELLIERGMDKLMEGRTVFVIAHRLSTVRNSNAIMVMEHGQIIERGNHDTLLAQQGRYYQLYTGMFELS